MGIFGPPNIEKLKAKKNIDGLIKALMHKDRNIRVNAVQALGEIGDVKAVEPLMRALKDNINFVRMNAAEALGKIGVARAVESLIEALKDNDRDTQRHAVLALKKIGSPAVVPLTKALENNDPDIQKQAMACLGKIADANVQALIRATADDQYEIQRVASEALGRIGEPAVMPLIQALDHIRSLEDYDFTPKSHLSLKDKDPLLKKKILGKVKIIRALGREIKKIGDKRAIKPLIQSLKDESSDVRKMAAEVLGDMGDERVVKPLIQSLKDEDCFVRCEAANALVRIGEPAVLPLIHTLKGKKSYIREEAIKALGKIGDKRAVEPIALLLGDESEDARKEATMALTRMGDIRAAEGIISELFLSERSRDEFSEELWENLFGDYTSLVLKASDKPTSTREITYEGRSGDDMGKVHYGFSEIDGAIHELCKIHTQIATNLLHKVSQRRDVEVIISWGCTGSDTGQLSFKSQREMAKKELERRGNPPYDPSAYLEKEAWIL